MSLSADQIATNRAAAVAAVRAQMDLPANRTDWTYEQRVAYDKALAAYILANGDQFGSTEISIAQTVLQQNYSPLEDDSFDWGEFASDTVKPLGDAAQNIGSGIFTVANAAKWAIPLIAVIAVIVLAEKYSGGTAISSVKKLAK